MVKDSGQGIKGFSEKQGVKQVPYFELALGLRPFPICLTRIAFASVGAVPRSEKEKTTGIADPFGTYPGMGRRRY